MELISSLEASADTVTVRAESRFAERYLREDFQVSYELDSEVESISEELVVIPFLANVAPIIWLAGLDVRVPALDATFTSALGDVRNAFAEMYPSMPWGGSISADRLTTSNGSTEQLALLFSGGVDSVYSSLRIDEQQLLVTVRGADIALNNDAGWGAVRRQAIGFATDRGHRNAFIESNFRRFLNLAELTRRWPGLGGWWGNVQHGIGLLGLLAPLAPRGRVVIAATHTPELGVTGWGSNPRLDTSLRWGEVEVDHHGYDASRQEKVKLIVAAQGPPPQLRVCFRNPHGEGGNCGVCEKCLRTFAALLVAGAEPSEYGMPMSRKRGTRIVRRRFATYGVALGANQAWHWRKIQEDLASSGGRRVGTHAAPDVEIFLRWLSGFDFDAYERHWRLLWRLRSGVFSAGRRFPIVERAARRLVSALERLRNRARQVRGL